jgi:hypothetical protein
MGHAASFGRARHGISGEQAINKYDDRHIHRRAKSVATLPMDVVEIQARRMVLNYKI